LILLDTHIWVWWVHDDKRLPTSYRDYIQAEEDEGIGVSAISCWEIAKLVEYRKLVLPVLLGEWLTRALE